MHKVMKASGAWSGRCGGIIIAVIACMFGVLPVYCKGVPTVKVAEICDLPEEFDLDGQPMTLAYRYVDAGGSIDKVFYGYDRKGYGEFIAFPTHHKDEDLYYSAEEMMADPEWSARILEITGEKDVAHLRKFTTYEIWAFRTTWLLTLLAIIAAIVAGIIYNRRHPDKTN